MSLFLNMDIRAAVSVAEENLIPTHEGMLAMDCVSKKDTAHFSRGQKLAWLMITRGDNFMTGMTKEGERFAKLQIFEDVSAMQITPSMIVNEVYDFLKRGHSIHCKQCTCQNKCAVQRQRQLFLQCETQRSGLCCRQDAKSSFFDVDIEFEIGAQSIRQPCFGSKSVAEVLCESGLFLFSESGWKIHAEHSVFDAESLCAFVQRHPLGVDMTNAEIQYEGLHRDAYTLQVKGFIFCIDTDVNKTPAKRLFCAYSVNGQKQADKDVRDLWHSLQSDFQSL